MGCFTTAACWGCQMGKGTPLLLFWEKSPHQKLREDDADPPLAFAGAVAFP